ncbi:pantothenate transporter liz1 [Xylariaceae sp. FL0804]|nr:pantothenate transporter liz1 [Xylariaceae sp. FL0804]
MLFYNLKLFLRLPIAARKYLRKLDGFMFTTIVLGYFIKYLDQQNISNAFVSGMQEDLNLYGNERNWLNTWFSLGVIIGSVPTMMFQLSWARPSCFIPTCELVWSALVMSMSAAKNIETLYALRFFTGLFEACAFPGYVALLGGWYGRRELTKRVAVLLEVESVAGMFSGYLQAGLYRSMDGRRGLAGWRWLFVMDGVVSLPIALWGFFGLPDLPHTTRAFYLGAADRAYAVERVERAGHRQPERLTWRGVKRIYTDWKIYAFVFPYVMLAACHTATSYFNLWLKAAGYSVVQANVLPTAGNAVAIVVTLCTGLLADYTGQRLIIINVLNGLMMLSNILLSVWDIPKGALMFAYYLSYAGAATTPVLIGWGADLNAGDPTLRPLLVASANIVSYAWVLWVPLVLFPTYDAPKYAYGYQILILFGGLAITGTCSMAYMYRRES